MNLGDAYVRVRPDTRGFAGEANRGLNSGLKSIAKVTAVALAASAAVVTTSLFKMGQQASDLAETVNKVNAIFGGAAGKNLEKWASGAAKSLGQSKQTALDAAATFGTFGKAAGKSGGDLAKFAKENTQLATDLASFHNTSPEEAIEALGAAFRGEAEPIRKFGVLLDDATLRNEAVKLGLIKTTKEALTPQQKVLAAQSAIMKQTTDAQGDFARTSGGLAGQQKILKAELANMGTTIGTKVLPFMLRLATFANAKVIPALRRFGDYTKTTIIPTVKDFAAKIQTNVLPVVARFGEIVGNNLKPILDRLVDVIKNQIIPTWTSWLPTIRDIATKIGVLAAGAVVLASAIAGKVMPPIISLVGWLVTFKPLVVGVVAAFVAWKVVTLAMAIAAAAQAAMTAFWTAAITVNIAISKAAAVASKAWAAAVWLVNLAMKANPIAKVIAVIALLVAAVIVAYKTSDKFRAIVDKAWAVIKRAVSVAWNGVIKPVLTAWWAYITKVLIPMIKFLWNNVVKPVFSSIGKAIKFAWNNVIQPVFEAWKAYLTKVVFPIIKFLYERVVKPIFSSISRTIKSVWENGIKPTFTKLKEGVGAIKTAFQKAVDGIRSVWKGLEGAARKPVQYVVNTVYTQGIKRVVDAIPGVGSLPNISFARGGVLPGYTPGRDVHEFYSKTGGRLHLSGGESFMVPEWTRAVGGPRAVDRMNNMARMGTLRRDGDLGSFAEGGLLNPIALQRAAAFAQSQAGKPYVLGGAGPNGYDCSGFMAAIANVLRGSNPYSRLGSTATFPWSGFKSGPGEFTIGSANPFPGSSMGHMAGTLVAPSSTSTTSRAMNVESSGGVGVRVGGGARGWNSAGFNEHAHLGGAGSGGGWFDIIGKVKGLWDKLHAAVAKLAGMGEWGDLMKKAVIDIASGIRDWINGKIPGPGPLPSFDRGGVAGGRGSLLKNTMRPERVLSPSQTETFEKLLSVAQKTGLGGIHYHGDIYTRDEREFARRQTQEHRKAYTMASFA